MKEIELEFDTNANAMGIMTFRRVQQGTNHAGKHVYIYSREYPDCAPSRFEVFIPSVKKAGIYKLPGDKTITYTEDFEEYPGAAKFGFSAWDCNSLPHAKMVYNRLMAIGEVVEIPEEIEKETSATTEPAAPKHRGRQKGKRPVLTVPIGKEFSVKELAAYNNVEYIVAAVFVKESATIKYVRSERRNPKGPETKLYIQPA